MLVWFLCLIYTSLVFFPKAMMKTKHNSVQSKYKVDSNNCRVFAQAVIQDATCFTDYDKNEEQGNRKVTRL